MIFLRDYSEMTRWMDTREGICYADIKGKERHWRRGGGRLGVLNVFIWGMIKIKMKGIIIFSFFSSIVCEFEICVDYCVVSSSSEEENAMRCIYLGGLFSANVFSFSFFQLLFDRCIRLCKRILKCSWKEDLTDTRDIINTTVLRNINKRGKARELIKYMIMIIGIIYHPNIDGLISKG